MISPDIPWYPRAIQPAACNTQAPYIIYLLLACRAEQTLPTRSVVLLAVFSACCPAGVWARWAPAWLGGSGPLPSSFFWPWQGRQRDQPVLWMPYHPLLVQLLGPVLPFVKTKQRYSETSTSTYIMDWDINTVYWLWHQCIILTETSIINILLTKTST